VQTSPNRKENLIQPLGPNLGESQLKKSAIAFGGGADMQT